MRINYIEQQGSTLLINCTEYESSAFEHDGEADVEYYAVMMPVAKTAEYVDITCDGFVKADGFYLEIPVEEAFIANHEVDINPHSSGWDGIVFENASDWYKFTAEYEYLNELPFDKVFFEEQSVALMSVSFPGIGYFGRVKSLRCMGYELVAEYEEVCYEELILTEISYELLVVPVPKNIKFCFSVCTGSEWFYPEKVQMPIENIKIIDVTFSNVLEAKDFDDRVFTSFRAWNNFAADVEGLSDLGYDEEFFKENSLAAAVVTHPATNYWIEVDSVTENGRKVYVKYYQCYADVGTDIFCYDLVFVPVTKDVRDADFYCIDKVNMNEEFQ